MTYPCLADLNLAQTAINEKPYCSSDDWEDISEHDTGDCKNYVVGKLRMLARMGWPVEALRVGICDVEPAARKPGICHAVLVVRLPDDSEIILDQRYSRPVTLVHLQRIGYDPIEIQHEGGRRGFAEWTWES